MLTISSTLRLGTRHALHHHRLLPAAVLAPSSPSKQNTLDAFLGMPPKRSRSPTAAGPGPSPSKKPKSKSSSPSKAQVEQGRKNAQGDLGDRATAQELKEDEGIGINERGETPYDELKRTLKEYSKKGSDDAETVVHWMRFKDLRISDNKGLAFASSLCGDGKSRKNLIVLFVISPGDYRSHHRSARRIDFTLRNLASLRTRLEEEFNVPLVVETVEERKRVPAEVVRLAKAWQAKAITANIEYEVDELRRDTETVELASKEGIQTAFLDDFCVVQPGKVTTQQGKPYSVYSPFYRNWSAQINEDLLSHIEASPDPSSNPSSFSTSHKSLFSQPVPSSVPGFELDADEQKKMARWWVAGEEAAEECLRMFFHSKLADGVFDQPPFNSDPASNKSSDSAAAGTKQTRIATYNDTRNRADLPGTSRLSPYLAAGIISPRRCLRKALEAQKEGKGRKSDTLETDRGSGIGMWVGEMAFREFYQHVLVAWPRVCMGRAFQMKYDKVVWEYDDDTFKAWTSGQTGFPLVDAAMRQCRETGYIHNRGRMTVASFLVKDLMLDWRWGEKWFMENLIDGDFGSNNGGWQWSAGCGTDPQPYFRIFQPVSQAEKADPNGDYIRHYVPELSKLSGKALYEPFAHMSKKEFEKLGYPEPIVDHKVARKRALARFKNPGSSANE